MFRRNILPPSSVLDCVGYINILQGRSLKPTGVGDEIKADAAQSGRGKPNGNSKWHTMCSSQVENVAVRKDGLFQGHIVFKRTLTLKMETAFSFETYLLVGLHGDISEKKKS